MKKRVFFAVLLLLGFIFGLWLARENRQFLEAMGLIKRPQENIHERPVDWNTISIGMETWQVKEALGPPEKRKVKEKAQETRKEEWTYGEKRLYFTNGILTYLGEEKPKAKEP
jgi:hypothetical protein